MENQGRSSSITPKAYNGREYYLSIDDPIFVEDFESSNGKTIKRIGLNSVFLKGQLPHVLRASESSEESTGSAAASSGASAGSEGETSGYSFYIKSSRELLLTKKRRY